MMVIKEFFVSDMLNNLPDEMDLKPFLDAMGYEHKTINILDEFDTDGGLSEFYDRYPTTALIGVALPDFSGFEVMGIYDTPDGPMALYLKPVSGLALKVKELSVANTELIDQNKWLKNRLAKGLKGLYE